MRIFCLTSISVVSFFKERLKKKNIPGDDLAHHDKHPKSDFFMNLLFPKKCGQTA